MIQAFKKERETLEQAATKMLTSALQSGAEAAEVCATYSQKTRISLEKQDYHMASSDDGYQLGVRVLKSERQGFASCNTVDAKELKEIAMRAVEIAGFSPHNPYYSIKASENVPQDAPTDYWDEALHNLSLQTQKDWTKLMVDEATKDARFRLNEGGMELSSSLYLIVNSHGTHKLERETAAGWSLMGMGSAGNVITSFDYFSEISRKATKAPERILASTRRFREELLLNLELGPTKSYKGLVVFSPRAVIDILLDSLSYHLNGRNVVEKTAKWGLTDVGKNILDPRITLRDMPWLSDRAGSSSFDREGTPTRNFTAVEKGKLVGFFMDHYAARALERASTGHASGGPTAPPSVGAHCLCLAPGEEALSDLRGRAAATQPDYLVVHRYSGQVDPVTGDFSGVAKGGEWWSRGERAYSVKETLISGNIFEAFGRELFGVSKETEVVFSSEETPTLVASGVSVTGAA